MATRILLVLLTLAVVAGCDEGWALAGRNNDDQGWLVRVRVFSHTSVFTLAPGDSAGLEAGIGQTPTDRIVELLDESCTVVASLVLDPVDWATVEITPEAELRVVNGYPPDDQLLDEPPLVGETCGGRPDYPDS